MVKARVGEHGYIHLLVEQTLGEIISPPRPRNVRPHAMIYDASCRRCMSHCLCTAGLKGVQLVSDAFEGHRHQMERRKPALPPSTDQIKSRSLTCTAPRTVRDSSSYYSPIFISPSAIISMPSCSLWWFVPALSCRSASKSRSRYRANWVVRTRRGCVFSGCEWFPSQNVSGLPRLTAKLEWNTSQVLASWLDAIIPLTSSVPAPPGRTMRI